MHLALTHHFDRSLDELWAMIADPEAHVAKYRHMGHRDVEVLRTAQGDGWIEIAIVRQVDVEVPAVAKRFIHPANTVTSEDRWERHADGAITGRSDVGIRGVPVASVGSSRLVAGGSGACDQTIELALDVKVPVVGERVAKAMRSQLEAQIRAEFAASEDWLAGR